MESYQQMEQTPFLEGEGVVAAAFGCIATSSKALVKSLQMVVLLQWTLFTLIITEEGALVEELASTLLRTTLFHISGNTAFFDCICIF